LFGYELAARAVSDPDGVVDWATSEITAIADRVSRPDDITPLSEVVRATIDDLERRQQARQAGECIGIPTGLQRLDALTGGWRGGQLVVLAGRPGMGKSATMLHFARAAAASGVPVCVYSLEMPAGQLAGRMLVGSSGVDSGAFRTGNVDGAGWTKIEKAGATLSGMPVYLNDSANITMGAIRSQCKAMHRRGRCGMVIIDYLQLLDTTTRNANSTREREIAAASRSAKLLAKELDVPVILLSQLSRKVEERADKTPLLSDLRESGAIEQDADMVLFLDRPAMYGAQTIDTNRYGLISSDGVGIMHVTKNREGATGRIYFRHNKSLTRITDYDSPATDAIGEAGPF
ncbi:AAA family ATPase, partial [Alistipes onderdonkii]